MNGKAEGPLVPPLDGQDLAALVAGIPQPIALTGATGFVGSHLLEALLAGGARVRVLVRDPGKLSEPARLRVEAVVGHLNEPAALQQLVRGVGTVLHLAGLVRAGRQERFFSANAEGTARLVAAATEAGCHARFLYVSSLAAAGPSPSPAGRAPEEPPAPVSAYGRSKLEGERAVSRYGGSWTILRPPAIYGPRDRDVFQFFQMASRGLLPHPCGERYVTVAFVGDVVLAVLRAAAGEHPGQVFHLGEPEPYALPELLQQLAAAGQVRARLLPIPPLVFRVAGVVGDLLQRLGFHQVAMTSDKARELLARHWTAQTRASLAVLGLPEPVPFAHGAELTWAWYRRQGWLPRAKIAGHERRSG